MTTGTGIGRVDSAASVAIPFIAAIAVVVLMLKFLALVPAQVESISDRLSPGHGFDSRLVSLDSIDAAELALNAEVWLPVYFPDYLGWPPSSITVQRYPEKNVTLTFRFSDQREALVLKQFLTTGISRGGMILQPNVVSRRSVIPVGDDEGVLVEGFDGEGLTRNVLYWTTQGRFVMMAGELPASELVSMAHSLRRVGHTPGQ